MNRRIILGTFLALVLVAGVLGFGAYTYNLGLAQGMVQSAALSDLAQGEGAVPPAYYYGRPFWPYHPFGFGFFGCFGPVFFIFFIFILFRGLWWGGRPGFGPGWRHHGYRERGMPAIFEEWHQQAHGGGVAPTSASSEG